MLTSKQRAFLRGMANGIDPILHAGKGGVSEAMIKQAEDALTAREILKGRVLESTPLPVKDVAAQLAEKTGAEVVQVIGRTFVLYRRNREDPQIVLPK